MLRSRQLILLSLGMRYFEQAEIDHEVFVFIGGQLGRRMMAPPPEHLKANAKGEENNQEQG